MKNKILTLFLTMLFCISGSYAEKDKIPIPPDQKWEETEERDISSPQLYQDGSSVYVYYEKQLDNVTIGITDMQGNVYHQEVTTVPACTYYAVSVQNLSAGQYYLCVSQGSKYVIGVFTINY